MSNVIDEGNKLGSFLNSWTKIISVIIISVSSCACAYYKIFDNERDIALERLDRIKMEQVIEERSDKRYARAMETAKELKDYIKYQEGRLLEMEKKQAFTEGYIKGKEFKEKK